MIHQMKLVVLFSFLVLFGCGADKTEKKSIVFDPSNQSIFTLLEDHMGHSMTLVTDLEKLIKSKTSEEYQEASLACNHNNRLCFSLDLKISPRGETRKRYCGFPPLKLNFNKGSLKEIGLNQFDHYKLVSHCDEEEYSEDIMLREYLVYKLYNELTPNSLHAGLTMMRYEDSKNVIPPFEKHAFLIEPIKEFCVREQLNYLDDPNLQLSSIHGGQYKLFTLFQYMIGNTDWNLSKRHNIKLVQKDGGSPIPVPYDFDYCGLVNAPYAVPHPQLPIMNIRERLFQYRAKNPDLTDLIQLFKEKKESLFKLCNQFEFLDESNRADMVAYLDSFYKIIEDPNLVQEKLIDKK